MANCYIGIVAQPATEMAVSITTRAGRLVFSWAKRGSVIAISYQCQHNYPPGKQERMNKDGRKNSLFDHFHQHLRHITFEHKVSSPPFIPPNKVLSVIWSLTTSDCHVRFSFRVESVW